MATTPTLKPKTLQEVLAEQAKTVTPVASPTASINQAQLEANKAKAAAREAARQAATVVTPTVLKPIDPNTQEGSVAFYKARGFDDNSAANMAKDYQVKMGNTTSWIDDTSVTGTQGFQDYLGSTISNYERTTGKKLDKNNYNSMYNTGKGSSLSPKLDTLSSPKVQVGKLVSDFNSTLKKTGSDKDAYYAGINYAGLTDEDKKRADTLFDMRQKAKEDKIKKTEAGMDIYDKYSDDLKNATEKIKSQYDTDKAAMAEAAKQEKEKMIEDYDTGASEYESAFTTFETEQNALLNNYESNRLNQVQGDIRRALLSRGVDISKVPPEQLIALSGDIGAKAFSDISGAKERATAAIENARQNKLAKVRELKSKKAITEAQYNKTLADINSTANQAKNNLDIKFAETVFGIKSAQETKKETTQTNTAQAIMNTAQALGISGSQFGVVNKFIQESKSTPEALQAMFAELSNPNSTLYTILQSNESAAAKQQAFKNQIDLLEAQAKLKSASRSGSAGTTTNLYYTGANQ